MQGIDISREYWLQCGKPAFESEFPELMQYIAVALTGSGSECFGYDDEISRDHDFAPGFCVFLPGEDVVDRRSAFLLERAYDKLPKEFMGLKKETLNPAGGNRLGIFRTSEWFESKTGLAGAPSDWRDFMRLPDYALAEAVNGEVFYDACGEFSAIRSAWSSPPQDYVRKKLCGCLISMSQSGEYNYPRCLTRGDLAAAHLCADEFVKAAIGAVLWTFGKPVPYYKWSFRALRELETERQLPAVSADLEKMLFTEDASELIEKVSGKVMEILKNGQPETGLPQDIQSAALELNRLIKDPVLRNLSPLAAV